MKHLYLNQFLASHGTSLAEFTYEYYRNHSLTDAESNFIKGLAPPKRNPIMVLPWSRTARGSRFWQSLHSALKHSVTTYISIRLRPPEFKLKPRSIT